MSRSRSGVVVGLQDQLVVVAVVVVVAHRNGDGKIGIAAGGGRGSNVVVVFVAVLVAVVLGARSVPQPSLLGCLLCCLVRCGLFCPSSCWRSLLLFHVSVCLVFQTFSANYASLFASCSFVCNVSLVLVLLLYS